MMKTHKMTAWVAGVALVLALVAGPAMAASCGSCGTDHAKEAKAGPTIVDVAQSAGQFNTLLAAAKAAGLAETLTGEGPYTVFAPTDAAFAKLPEGTVESLLENPDKLRTILLYHVVPGKVMAEQVVKLSAAKTALGQPVAIKTGEDGVKVDAAKVVKTDILASNGVIHVIDKVIMPKDIVGVAAGTDAFSTLVAAVKAAGLVEVLQGDGPYTVFAPTNAAFAKLPEGTLESLLKPENKELLVGILKYHVVPGSLKAANVVALESTPTAHGESLSISSSEEHGVRIEEAKVLETDIITTNGVIHVIDTVMLPQG